MQVLATEFSSKLQEQAGNKFVDAPMDTKFAIKLAEGLFQISWYNLISHFLSNFLEEKERMRAQSKYRLKLCMLMYEHLYKNTMVEDVVLG